MRDFISQLPNELLHKILLNLKTSESVRTSVLSSRWRHVWQSVPGLIFHHDKRDVKDFLDRFLNLHKELPIYKFTLKPSGVYIPSLKLLIDQILTRQVQLLRLDGLDGLDRINLPVSFYTCETLVSLHLVFVKLDDFDGNEFINLPRLRVMHLDSVSTPSDAVLKMLISCSPVLQDLKLGNIPMGCVEVRSQSLKSLILTCIQSSVVIDTPKLEFLSINFAQLKNIRVKRISSPLKLCIGGYVMRGINYFSNMQIWHKFFVGILPVADLNIAGHTLQLIYNTKILQHQQLPEFKNLLRLCVCFYGFSIEILLPFLSSCPNLKSFNLELYYSQTMVGIGKHSVPRCLQTSIEDVQIKMAPMDYRERNREAETEFATKFAKYILKNATALKKLTIWLDEEKECNSSQQPYHIDLEQIFRFRKSPSVEVEDLQNVMPISLENSPLTRRDMSTGCNLQVTRSGANGRFEKPIAQ